MFNKPVVFYAGITGYIDSGFPADVINPGLPKAFDVNVPSAYYSLRIADF